MRRAVLIAGALLLSACAAVPKAWYRPDGAAVAPAQITMDETACRGETSKADAQAGKQNNLTNLDSPFGPDPQHLQVFEGCMAQRGYLQR